MRATVGITGVGVCCPLGRSMGELWIRVARGDDGFVSVDRFPLPGLNSPQASAFDGPQVAALCAEAGHDDPAVAYAILAGRGALGHHDDLDDVALVVATSAGAADRHDAYDQAKQRHGAVAADAMVGGAFTSLAFTIARGLRLTGPCTTVSTACASGTHALGLGIDLIRSGDARRVLVIGTDSLHPSLFGGFHSVGALASEPCSPFGAGFGMSLGEGAAAMLLEPNPADPIGVLLGWGGACDAYHPTAPDPRGAGMARAIVDALDDAGVQPSDVGAYNAHGTGTEANDPAETLAVRATLGSEVPVSASKSQLGHTQGAAGMLEGVITLAGLRHQAVPPTLRCDPPRRIAPADPVAGGRARPHDYTVAVSNSAAFGGTNTSVVVGLAAVSVPAPPPAPIYATGTGATGPFGDRAGVALDPTTPPHDSGRSRVRLRRMDPITALLTTAIAAATADAGLDTTQPSDRVAMVVGMADGPQQSIRGFVDSRDQRGLDKCSAAAFARMVFNAPAGGAAAALQLRGTNLTLWSGHGAGAHAVAVGARLLGQHPSLDAVVAAAADEDGHISQDRGAMFDLPGQPVSAGGAIVLSRTPGHARLVGAAWGAAADWRRSAERALRGMRADRIVVSARAGVVDVDHFGLDATLGHAPAASGVLASAAAIDWIRTSHAQVVLVIVVSDEGGSTALVWAAPTVEVPE